MTRREREMLDALLDEADLVAGAQLLDLLVEARDTRAAMFSHCLGLLNHELNEVFDLSDQAQAKSGDGNEWVGAKWSESAEASAVWAEARKSISGLFWTELNDAHQIEDTTRRLKAALEFAATGEGRPQQ